MNTQISMYYTAEEMDAIFIQCVCPKLTLSPFCASIIWARTLETTESAAPCSTASLNGDMAMLANCCVSGCSFRDQLSRGMANFGRTEAVLVAPDRLSR